MLALTMVQKPIPNTRMEEPIPKYKLILLRVWFDCTLSAKLVPFRTLSVSSAYCSRYPTKRIPTMDSVRQVKVGVVTNPWLPAKG